MKAGKFGPGESLGGAKELNERTCGGIGFGTASKAATANCTVIEDRLNSICALPDWKATWVHALPGTGFVWDWRSCGQHAWSSPWLTT